MANRSSYSIIIFFLMGVMMSSCASGQSGPPVTVSPVSGMIEPTKTLITPTPIAFPATTTPGITITPSPAPEGYAGLSDGEYLLALSQNGLEVISIENHSHFELLSIAGWAYLSQDQRQLIIVSSDHHKANILNLETMVEEELPFLKGCAEVILPSDGTAFLAACESPDYFSEIYSISRDGNKKVQLTNCGIDYGDCGGIAYSPDGQWIFYSWGLAGSGQSSKEGLYLTKSNCINTENKCEEMAIGPFQIDSGYIWAPNGEYFACSSENAIRLYKVMDNTILEFKELFGVSALRYSRNFATWSPDSTHLAYTTGNEIRLIDVDGGKPEFFMAFNYDVYLIGWVTIQDGKVSP